MSFCTVTSVVVHYPIWGCAEFRSAPHQAPHINSRGNLVVTLSYIPKNGDGSIPGYLCYNRDIGGGFIPQYVGCAKVVNVKGVPGGFNYTTTSQVELEGHHPTLLNAIKANGLSKGCMCAPQWDHSWTPPAGGIESSYGPYPQGSAGASLSAVITSSQIAQKHPSSGTWHYFDEYYCPTINTSGHRVGFDFACKPSLRKSVAKLNTVAIHETYLPIGGGDVCTLDPGNTFHFAIKVSQREVNYTETTNCCVGLHRCCAFCFCGQDGLGINVLPYPYWSENNCDNCHSAVMTYFSSMASQIPGYTMPNVCWASTVHCNDLKNSLISFGCSSGVGYQTTASSSSGGSA
tara:strand:+ start:138 stop:1175 length:1038 start_codon:yes stop_codon:yes gene_type:complete